MNLRIIVLVPVVAMAVWLLSDALRKGEFRYKSWRMGSLAHVVRNEQPAMFWIYVALHAGAIAYLIWAALDG